MMLKQWNEIKYHPKPKAFKEEHYKTKNREVKLASSFGNQARRAP